MFEKIEQFAETLATSAGESRRGFLGRLATGAWSVAGVLGGLLLSQGEALAANCNGGCTYQCPNGEKVVRECLKGCTCDQTIQHRDMTCGLFHFGCVAR